MSNTRMAQWTLTLVNRGVTAETVSKPDLMTHTLTEKGIKHKCPKITLEKRNARVQAPPIKELNTMGQKKHIWFTDSSSVAIQGKKRIRYATINLEEKVIKG